MSAIRTATTAMITRPSGVGSGMSIGVTSMTRSPRRRRPLLPRRRAAARLLASLGGLVQTVDPAPDRAALAVRRAGASRPASQRLPSRTASADDGPEQEQADLDASRAPEDLVVADALVPDRVGPQVDADDEHHDDEDRDADDDDVPIWRRRLVPPPSRGPPWRIGRRRRRAADRASIVVRRSSSSALAASASPSSSSPSARARSSRVGAVAVVVVRRRRRGSRGAVGGPCLRATSPA